MPIKPTKPDSSNKTIRGTQGEGVEKTTHLKQQKVGKSTQFSKKEKVEQPIYTGAQKPILQAPTQKVNFNNLDEVQEKMKRPVDKEHAQKLLSKSVSEMYPGFPQGNDFEKELDKVRPTARAIINGTFSEEKLEQLPKEMQVQAKDLRDSVNSLKTMTGAKESDIETIMGILLLISELQSTRGRMKMNEMKGLSDKQHNVMRQSQAALVESRSRGETAEGIGKANNIVGILLGVAGLLIAAAGVLMIVASFAAGVMTGGAALALGIPAAIGLIVGGGMLVYQIISAAVGQDKMNEFIGEEILAPTFYGGDKKTAKEKAHWWIMGTNIVISIVMLGVTLVGVLIAIKFTGGAAAPVGAALIITKIMNIARGIQIFTQLGQNAAQIGSAAGLGVPQTVYAYESLRFQSESLSFKALSEEIEKTLQHVVKHAQEAFSSENEFMRMVIRIVNDQKETVLKTQSNI